MKTKEPAAFCAAMQKAVPYLQSKIIGQCKKPYWGQRQQNIKEQYSKYVPPKFVEDEFQLSKAGCSNNIPEATAQFLHPHTLAVLPAGETTIEAAADTFSAVADDSSVKEKKFRSDIVMMNMGL